MTFSLQQSDVRRLMAQPSPHMRAVVAGKLANEIDNPNLSEADLSLARDIVRLLAQDVHLIVRLTLANSLRNSKRLPHDVAWKLASDVEAVALPIILDSEILTDEDLLMLVRDSNVVKQKAVASRRNLSEPVSDLIVDTTGEVVVTTLMSNNSARISDMGLHKAMDRFGKSDPMKEAMVKRTKLPVSITARLIGTVSIQLKNYLLQHHELPLAMAEELSQQSRERAIVQLGKLDTLDKIEKLVMQMHRDRKLTPTLIVRALCSGNLPFFEFGLSLLAGVPIVNTRALIHDPGPAGLTSLWEKASMPAPLMALVRTALDTLRKLKIDGKEPDMQRFRTRLIERILTQLGNAGQDELDYLMDLMQ